jgi:hypothetical protein
MAQSIFFFAMKKLILWYFLVVIYIMITTISNHFFLFFQEHDRMWHLHRPLQQGQESGRMPEVPGFRLHALRQDLSDE